MGTNRLTQQKCQMRNAKCRILEVAPLCHLPFASRLELEAKANGHPVERPAVDAENLGGPFPVSAGGLQHDRQIASFHLVDRREIGEQLCRIDRLRLKWRGLLRMAHTG